MTLSQLDGIADRLVHDVNPDKVTEQELYELAHRAVCSLGLPSVGTDALFNRLLDRVTRPPRN